MIFSLNKDSNLSIKKLCSIAKVSTSGYYSWLNKEYSEKDLEIIDLIKQIRKEILVIILLYFTMIYFNCLVVDLKIKWIALYIHPIYRMLEFVVGRAASGKTTEILVSYVPALLML